MEFPEHAEEPSKVVHKANDLGKYLRYYGADELRSAVDWPSNLLAKMRGSDLASQFWVAAHCAALVLQL